MSQFDKQFKATCRRILEEGVSTRGYEVRARWEDGEPAHTIKLSNVVNTYDVGKEFPILTLRKSPMKNAIDEILWIWQKKSNNVNELNSRIWDAWANEEGTIGKAYGWQLSQEYNYDGRICDPVDNILWTLKNNPMDRRMIADMFVAKDLHEMGLAPCCHHVNLIVVGDRLDMLLKQRSQDMAVANGWNVSQYSILLHMLSRHAGLKPGVLTHVISDCHIYERHIDGIKEMLEREEFEAPVLKVADKTDFYSWTVEDFELENYKFGSPIRFEVAV
ncbi:MAG: thymidylate synthase [Sarcina sp.]